jgi:hypothetical protein
MLFNSGIYLINICFLLKEWPIAETKHTVKKQHGNEGRIERWNTIQGDKDDQ